MEGKAKTQSHTEEPRDDGWNSKRMEVNKEAEEMEEEGQGECRGEEKRI